MAQAGALRFETRSHPPLRALPPVPVYLTRFVGRERELEQLGRLLTSCRLLTLTGPGGSGKTRLAVELVARVPESADVVWIDLAPITASTLLPQYLAGSVGLREDRGHAAEDSLIEFFREREAVVVLDNCEHLIDACAKLVATLLHGCPRLRVVATSREPLGITGEQSWLVPPLSLPDGQQPSRAAGSEAMQLFVERAQAVSPAFAVTDDTAEAVADICRRLDGLPLAIELAAARVRVLTPAQIAHRLEDSFELLEGSRTAVPRQRTLGATIDWSYTLLADRDRSLLRRLAVFACGLSLDAVEAVCGFAPIERQDVLPTLSALVDKSMVVSEARGDSVRYRLLETVRQYLLERLREVGEEPTVRERHAAYFLALAESSARPMFGGAGDEELVARLSQEHANFRVAAEWFGGDPGRADDALRMAAALHWFWFAGGHFREGRATLTAALKQSATADPQLRARALTALGHVALWQGDHAAVTSAMNEAVSLLLQSPDRYTRAYAMAGLGAALSREESHDEALAILEEAVRIARSLELGVLLPFTLYWLGLAAEAHGRLNQAQASFEEANRHARALGHKPSIAHSLHVLGRLERRRGNPESAIQHLAESLSVHQQTNDRWGLLKAMEELARVAVDVGRGQSAVELISAADELREGLGVGMPETDRIEMQRLMESLRITMGQPVFDAAVQAGRTLTVERLLEDLQECSSGPGVASQLRVFALGPVQIVSDGAILGSEVWRSVRSRELLLFLACHPEGATREQIGVTFWPEASAAKVRNNVNVTVHRLRQALGHPDWIVLDDDRYVLARGVLTEFDVHTFEREVAAGLRDLRAGLGPGRLDAALCLYRGDFLESESAGDWHLEIRYRLQRVYLEACVALGDWWLDQGNNPEAAVRYRRAIARDPIHEKAYRRLMTCHARLGERAESLRLYQNLSDRLRSELEVEPDPETTSLFERLRTGEVT